jgi:ABC-type transporter Mla MlaB component
MRRPSHPDACAELRPPLGPRSVVLMVEGPLGAPAVADLCAQVRSVVRSGVDVVTCDVGQITDPDAGAVDAVARLQLTARRHGGSVRLRRVSRDLRRLLDLAGLRHVIPSVPDPPGAAR